MNHENVDSSKRATGGHSSILGVFGQSWT